MSAPRIERRDTAVYLVIGADRFELSPLDLLRMRTEIDEQFEAQSTVREGDMTFATLATRLGAE